MFAFVEAQPEWSHQETIYNTHDLFMYSLSITISHCRFEFSKVFRDFSVDPHLCHCWHLDAAAFEADAYIYSPLLYCQELFLFPRS